MTKFTPTSLWTGSGAYSCHHRRAMVREGRSTSECIMRVRYLVRLFKALSFHKRWTKNRVRARHEHESMRITRQVKNKQKHTSDDPKPISLSITGIVIYVQKTSTSSCHPLSTLSATSILVGTLRIIGTHPNCGSKMNCAPLVN